jgi:hypothetical protein
VRHLIFLEIVKEKVMKKASNGEKQAISLSFTHAGYLLAWIINSFEEKNRPASDIQIYKILEYIHRESSSSFEFFALALMEKYRSLELFEELVGSTLRDRVNNTRWQIDTVSGLIDSLSIPNLTNANLFYHIWLQTLNELEENQRDIVMQYVKLG